MGPRASNVKSPWARAAGGAAAGRSSANIQGLLLGSSTMLYVTASESGVGEARAEGDVRRFAYHPDAARMHLVGHAGERAVRVRRQAPERPADAREQEIHE